MEKNHYSGSIHVILGCMFSGKTTELLRNVKRYQSIGKTTMVINYSLDTRYGENSVVSHDSLDVPAYMVSDLSDIFQNKNLHEKYSQSQYLFINEGQFFSGLKKFCVDAANIHNKIIFVCGLDENFQQKQFGEMIDLIPVSETVVKLHALCKVCGMDACFTRRIVQNEETVLIGNGNMYEAVCRKHYFT